MCAISILLGSILIFQCEGQSTLSKYRQWRTCMLTVINDETLALFAGCNRDVEIVSHNRGLLPLDGINALQGAAGQMGFSLDQVVSPMLNEFWCASVTAGNYVNMTFTEPILVEGIISSGAATTRTPLPALLHYVSNFSILFSQDISGQLQLYDRVCLNDNRPCMHAQQLLLLLFLQNYNKIFYSLCIDYFSQCSNSLPHHQILCTMSTNLSLPRNSSSGLMDMDQTNCFAGK